LRRTQRARSIQASLAIEGNTLGLERVTAILDGRRVVGSRREIQEVRNAILAYEKLPTWDPCRLAHLLEAHGVMMAGLVDRPGEFRHAGVGIQRGGEVIHVAPPAGRVRALVQDLLGWLHVTDDHPLVASCVFHYEFEFIHPFPDGNGRTGRLWQTLILSRWKPVLAHVPLESVVHDRQAEYYAALRRADDNAEATPFLEFMLGALLEACQGAALIDQVTDQVSDQVRAVLELLRQGARSGVELMRGLGLSHRPTFRRNYLKPALAGGWVEMTDPASLRSPQQRYRLTNRGHAWLAAAAGVTAQ
jgi:Fic family protein